MKIRFLFFTLTILLIAMLCACGSNTEELESRFDKILPDNNVLAVLDDTVLYFSDHTLNLKNIIDGEKPNGGYCFVDGTLYFSTSRENGAYDFSFLIYKCDIDGNNIKLVFEKHSYRTHPWAVANNGTFYVEYFSNNAFDEKARTLDRYSIFSGTYETVSTGEDIRLSDYRENRKEGISVTKNDESIDIVDARNNAIYKIEHEMLHTGELGESLSGIKYEFYDVNIVDGRIYLIYRIQASTPYPYFICEYISETNGLRFTTFFLSDDIDTIHVERM